MTEIKVGLTQFLDFTLKGSTAKTTFIKNLKSQPEYQPAFDYWKQLRETVIKFHQNKLPFECFETLVQTVDQKKKQNYIDVIKQYKKFIKNKEISWFDPGKSYWKSDDLIVRSSPELGLFINNEPHLIKLFFKGKKERIDKYNINSTLTLLNESTFSNERNDVNYTVLNIQKNRMYTNNSINNNHLVALKSEANQFCYIWNNL
ncbi:MULTISPECIES: hypothetical protein [Bacillus cereus group]|uniref:hypothetical protein n=1 Tax=Bacillus cereus group TaxID=86661 RepID=UPI000BF51D2D|nr:MULTISPECIES: hypothetical protein [Bacillus cereus group]PFD37648.1 hypothetical protein CN281_31080 [Bacillus cereus]PFH95694.1 hypothetical protein COI78_09000 [Bacillus cereus]PFO50036.1 hypothetical protein COJ81_25865 [Bacillus cereus]PWE72934.1 hypothetical protein B1R38_14620 [Bacillus cereus]QEL79320.1 hypothetical protein DN407_12035 [Bacillus sp. JAS24-2]